MAYEKPKTFRVISAIPVPVNAEVDKYAGLAGMSKTQFLGILIQLGLNSWIRAYAPEKMLSSDDWNKITKAMSDRLAEEGGIDVTKLFPSS